jgi:hypothetical protein
MLVACNSVEPPAVPDPSPREQKRLWEPKALPFALQVDSTYAQKMEERWNSSFGRLEIEISPQREVFVLQSDYDVSKKLADLDLEIFENEFLIRSDTLLIYESRIPEGSSSYWHFFRTFEVNGESYYVENNPLIACTKSDVELMSEIFSIVKPSKEG